MARVSNRATDHRAVQANGAKVRTWPYLIGNRYDIVANPIVSLRAGLRSAQTDPA